MERMGSSCNPRYVNVGGSLSSMWRGVLEAGNRKVTTNVAELRAAFIAGVSKKAIAQIVYNCK